MFFFLVVGLIACSKPPPLLEGYDESNLVNNWWQLEVENEIIIKYIEESYGYPPCFFLETDRKLAFIANRDYEYWSYSYEKIDSNTYLLDNDIEINVSRVDSDQLLWYLTLRQNFLQYDGYAYDCTYISEDIQTSSLE